MNQLPLVQDSLLWSLPGWYVEHTRTGSIAENGACTLTITALNTDFELVLTSPNRPGVCQRVGPHHSDVLDAITHLAAGIQS